jgi:putative lipoprotein
VNRFQLTFGDKAELEIDDTRYADCTNNRANAIWEDAKFRGVAFMAVGNESGWQLEVNPSEAIVFFGDYGNTLISIGGSLSVSQNLDA